MADKLNVFVDTNVFIAVRSDLQITSLCGRWVFDKSPEQISPTRSLSDRIEYQHFKCETTVIADCKSSRTETERIANPTERGNKTK